MTASFSLKSGLQIEQLETRSLLAGNITTVTFPSLDSDAALIVQSQDGSSRIIVAGMAEGTPFLGSAPLTVDGELTGDISIDPAAAEALFGQIGSGLDIGGQLIPGAFEGHPALFDLNGSPVWSDPAVNGKISLLYETSRLLGLVEKASGEQQLMLSQSVKIDIPNTIFVESMLKPIAGETTIYLGGKNKLNGNPTVVEFDVNLQTFSLPVDIILGASNQGSVKALTRAADGSDEPVAIVEVYGVLPGGVPIIGSIWLGDPDKAEVFGPSNGGKVFADRGVTVYQGDGDWFVHIGSKTMSHLTDLPRGVAISLSGLLSDGGFGNTTVNEVTSVFTDNFGKICLVSDIEVQGFSMTSVISIFDRYPLNNKTQPFDSNNDGFVSPLDALVIINHLNLHGTGDVADFSIAASTNISPNDVRFPFLDTKADGFISPIDVLVVINYLNLRSGGSGEGEADLLSDISNATGASLEHIAALLADQDVVESFKRRRVKS